MISFDILIKDLINLGVKKGDVLVVHSSLKSMGKVDGGANTVIDALIEVVGKEGTILFPALTYSPCYSTLKFDVKNTPSCVGYISEVFRNRPDIIRSFHPTHSVCAFGKFAKEITKDHFIDDTPVGENSPFHKGRISVDFNGLTAVRNSADSDFQRFFRFDPVIVVQDRSLTMTCYFQHDETSFLEIVSILLK